MEGWHYMMVLLPLLLSKLPALRGYQVVPGPRYLCRNHPPHSTLCGVSVHVARQAGGGRGSSVGFPMLVPEACSYAIFDPTWGNSCCSITPLAWWIGKKFGPRVWHSMRRESVLCWVSGLLPHPTRGGSLN